jgi:hypothetical protein
VKEKLETKDNWDKTQCDQSLHKLINKIKRICVGFYDHKQEVFNLVQALKTPFLYKQAKKRVSQGVRPQLQEPLGCGRGIWRIAGAALWIGQQMVSRSGEQSN